MADSNPSSSIVMPISLSVSLAGFLAATLALLYLWHKYSGPGEYTVKKGSRVSRPQPGCHYQTLPGRE
jgi:hypothetical protein